MKRIFIFLLIISLCSVLLGSAYGEEFTSGDYSFTILANGSAEIINYSGNDTDLNIPEKLDDHPVSSIGDGAFSGTAFSLQAFHLGPDHGPDPLNLSIKNKFSGGLPCFSRQLSLR